MENDIRHKKKWTKEDVLYILKIANMCNVQSLNYVIPTEDDNKLELGDTVKYDGPSPEDLVEQKDAKEMLLRCINKLSPRQQKIILLRYGLYDGRPKTLDEVGKMYGVTRERIRQLENKALLRLKHLLITKEKIKGINDI